MLVRFFVTSEGIERVAQIVLHTRRVACMSGLLKIETGSGVLVQRTINIVLALLYLPQISKDQREVIVESPLGGEIAARFIKRSRLDESLLGIMQTARAHVNHGDVKPGSAFLR